MTSELPASEDTARLPALATGTPAAATTSATAVEMLNVPRTSPPVPQVSMVPSGAATARARERMARTKPASSPAVSPRACSPMSRPPSWAGVTWPSRTATMKRSASSGVSSAAGRDDPQRAADGLGRRFGHGGSEPPRSGWVPEC